MITDDPGTPGDGHWEINVQWTTENRPGQRIQNLPLAEFNYGIGERVQLDYATAWIHRQADGLPSHAGLGNSCTGLKWRFADENKTGLDVSVHPQFEFRNPGTSAVSNCLVSDENLLLLPLEFQKMIGPVSVVAEVGRAFPSKSAGEWFYGVAMVRAFGPRLTAGLEFNGWSTPALERSGLTLNLGVHYEFRKKSGLLFALGRELHNRCDPRATLLLTLGWQWVL